MTRAERKSASPDGRPEEAHKKIKFTYSITLKKELCNGNNENS